MLTIEEQFRKEEILRKFLLNVRRALIILSVLPETVLEDITTTLMFLGAGVVQIQTAESYPEIIDTYIEKIESEIYVEIQNLEEMVLDTITKLRSENIFSELVDIIKENNVEGYEEVLQRFPIINEIFEPLEQRIRDLI